MVKNQKAVMRTRDLLRILITICIVVSLLFSDIYATNYYAPVTRVTQAYSNWCWAASAEMVGKVIDSSSDRDQYDIAEFVKGSNPPNEGATNSEMVTALNYSCNLSSATFLSSVMTFSACKACISNYVPFVVRIRWGSTSNYHAVVADAANDVNNKLRIVDPASGCSNAWYSYDSLIAGTTIQSGSNGKWVHTWIVQ